jgi:OmpA-OmpF porin, OOP family
VLKRVCINYFFIQTLRREIVKKIVIAFAVLLASFIAAPAIAANAYLGINAGQNKMDFSGAKESTAYSVFGGYIFNEYIAGELAYTDFGSADTNVSGVSLKGNAVSVAAVGSLPLGKDFSLFAKLGYASTSVEATGGSSESKDDVTYGIGAQYNATKDIGIRLGYDSFRVGKTQTKDSNFVSLGVLFKF